MALPSGGVGGGWGGGFWGGGGGGVRGCIGRKQPGTAVGIGAEAKSRVVSPERREKRNAAITSSGERGRGTKKKGTGLNSIGKPTRAATKGELFTI